MKTCVNCGAALEDRAKFCTKCGCRIEDTPMQSTYNLPTEDSGQVRKKRKKWLPIIILIVCVAAIGALAAAYMNSPIREVLNRARDMNSGSAVQIYNIKIDGNPVEEWVVRKLLPSIMDGIERDWADGKVDATLAINYFDELTSIRDSTLSKCADKHLTNVSKVVAAESNFTQAEAFYDNGEYGEAIDFYASIPEKSDLYEEAQKKLGECQKKYREQVIFKAENATKEGNPYASFEELNKAHARFPEDEQINTMLKSAIAACEELTAANARSYVKDGKYGTALGEIESSLEILGDSQKLSDLYDEIEQSKPMPLSDVPIIDSNRAYEYEPDMYTDSYGNTYMSAHTFYPGHWLGDDKEGIAYFNLDRQYKKFKGSIIFSEESDINSYIKIFVYADDALVYQSDTLTKLIEKTDFEIDVSGVKKLEIKAVRIDGYSSEIAIVNANLFKK